MEKGPWLFAGQYMVLRKWRPGLPLSKANLNRIPVWAKFHNVPIELWTEAGLSHIASAVGLPLYADATTKACSRISFARICIEVDASVPLVEEFEVEMQQEDSTSTLVTISVSYQWRTPICELCQVFGHVTSSCAPPIQHSTAGPLAQTLENSNQLDQSGVEEDRWQLVERHKRISPSRRNSASISNASQPGNSQSLNAPSSRLESPTTPGLSVGGDRLHPSPSSIGKGVSTDVSSLATPSTLAAGPSNTQPSETEGALGTSPLLQILTGGDARHPWRTSA